MQATLFMHLRHWEFPKTRCYCSTPRHYAHSHPVSTHTLHTLLATHAHTCQQLQVSPNQLPPQQLLLLLLLLRIQLTPARVMPSQPASQLWMGSAGQPPPAATPCLLPHPADGCCHDRCCDGCALLPIAPAPGPQRLRKHQK